MKLKNINNISLMTGLFALPIIACGNLGHNNDFGDEVEAIYVTKNIFKENDGSIEIQSHPNNDENDITVGIFNKQETLSNNKNGDWKNKNIMRGASVQALVDIVNNFNQTIGKTKNIKIKLKLISHDSNLIQNLITKNASSIPNIIFASQSSYQKFKKFEDIFFKFDDNLFSSFNDEKKAKFIKEKNFLPFARESLIGIIDYKLINGLIYSYNNYLQKDKETKIYNNKLQLVAYNDPSITENDYKSFKYKDNSKQIFTSLKNIAYDEKIFGNEALSYKKLSSDFNFWITLAKNIKIFKNIKYGFTFDFAPETIYSFAKILAKDKKIFNENNDIINNKYLTNSFDIINSLIQNENVTYRKKLYTTTNFENQNSFLDITKGFALNYYLDNNNLKYMQTPGFSYNDYKGFFHIKPKKVNIKQNEKIKAFLDFLYNGKFTSNFNIYNNDVGLENLFDDVSPSTYYGLLSKYNPITKESTKQINSINEIYNDFNLSSRTSEIFRIYNKKTLDIINPDNNNKKNFIESLNEAFLRNV